MTTSSQTVMQMIAAKDLKVHPYAQRTLLPSKLKKIENTLDLDAIGTLHAVRYGINGVLGTWVVDGQHRLQALLNHGFGDWQCNVMLHTTVKDDASSSRLFLRLNDRAPVSPWAKFENEVKSQDVIATRIVLIVDNCGLKISKSAGPGSIRSISSLKNAYALDGGGALASSLKVMKAAWGGSAGSLEGVLIEGFSLFFKEFAAEIVDSSPIVSRLQKEVPVQLIARAKMQSVCNRQTVAMQLRDDLVRIFNARRRSKGAKAA